MTEKTTIKLMITGEIGGIYLKTTKWIQTNRYQIIAAIYDLFKPEIIACSGASERDLNTARLEALAYHEYRAKVLRAQLYGHLQPLSPSERSDDPIQLPPIKPSTITDRPTATHNGNSRSTVDLLDNL